ncbi:MAG: glutathione S-transferase family protein [Saccharospirillaceae bacterium]|nr:glutathione S-transferase family protein [Pseudomonadales bacterium]NRB79003.1 glutathione S-transferase family protein [Saccharospirillaceae bacterium]
MPNYKLTYFDFDGGRAEAIRIAFHSQNIKFEDHRISFAQFAQFRKTTPFNSIPVLNIDSILVTQTNPILSYVGKMTKLYPTDDLQILYCEEVMSAIEDISHQLVKTFGLKDDVLKQARKKFVEGWLSTILKGLESLIIRSKGDYFCENQLTVADLKCFVQVNGLSKGFLDHVPTDIVETVAPQLFAHFNRMKKEPIIQEYYKMRENSK